VSVLTKVFVVLLTVFSIALSMLVVAAFAEQQKWKEAADGFRASQAAAQAKADAITKSAEINQSRALDRHQEDVRAMNALKDDVAAKEAKITELERAKAEAENKLTIALGQVTSSGDQNKLLVAALNREKEFGSKLALRNSDLERRNIDMNDRVKELTVNVSMATSQIRALQQQIASMETTGGTGPVTQIPGGPGLVEAGTPSAAAPSIPSSAAPIRGEITSVKGNLASISVGNADGVSPGMVFLIYRKSNDGGAPQYLGSLRVNRVEANESAGQLEQTVGDIKQGDSVRDEMSFARKG
jgi:hypothetical protein